MHESQYQLYDSFWMWDVLGSLHLEYLMIYRKAKRLCSRDYRQNVSRSISALQSYTLSACILLTSKKQISVEASWQRYKIHGRHFKNTNLLSVLTVSLVLRVLPEILLMKKLFICFQTVLKLTPELSAIKIFSN